MDQKTLIARIRQLLAADKNALDIYTELSKLSNDQNQRKIFSSIAEDEKRHTILSAEALLLLE